jgi:hypothetical protein
MDTRTHISGSTHRRLPVAAILQQARLGDQEEKLNHLLPELAWDAVVQHPLSGVRE